MQTAKARGSPKDSPKKASLRPVRQLKIDSVDKISPSSSNLAAARIPKDRSPKVIERRSPRSPISEKKRPRKWSELESQITQLENDLNKVKDQLVATELSKKEALADAEELKRQLADVSLKLEESQKELTDHTASKQPEVVEPQSVSQENEPEWETLIESAREQQYAESAALASALEENQKLKLQLEKFAESTDAQEKQIESTQAELESLKDNLAETLALVETMKHELKHSRESEAQAQELVRQTLLQLEAAKEACNSMASELDQSGARASSLESLVSKHKADLVKGDIQEISDVGQLNSALEAAEIRYNEERSHSNEQLRNASELLEQVKARAGLREAELEAELEKARSDIEELKANLMDKETELQGISEENESLSTKLEKSMSSQREDELENEVKKLRERVEDMKSSLMDKGVQNEQVVAEVEASRAAEVDAMTKLGYMMEEVEKSNRKAARVTEQLEAAQSANAQMEAELRRLKVQSDQWRKAAEAAASMLSPGTNGKYVERTGSMPLDGEYSLVGRKVISPYLDDYDDDSFKKKNGNVLKKIGVLWKKPQK